MVRSSWKSVKTSQKFYNDDFTGQRGCQNFKIGRQKVAVLQERGQGPFDVLVHLCGLQVLSSANKQGLESEWTWANNSCNIFFYCGSLRRYVLDFARVTIYHLGSNLCSTSLSRLKLQPKYLTLPERQIVFLPLGVMKPGREDRQGLRLPFVCRVRRGLCRRPQRTPFWVGNGSFLSP